jgi:hypothetical protein
MSGTYDPSAPVTVCSECLRASCWQGIFYCEDYKRARTTRKPIAELRALKLESPDYWTTRQ